MLLHIYVYRDKALSCYDSPLFMKEDKDQYATAIARAVAKAGANQVDDIKDKALYYLGDFDDVAGKFLLLEHEEKLIDLEDYIPRKDVEHAD